MISRIHVNQQLIRSNKTAAVKAPVLTIKRGGKTEVANEIEIKGPSKVVYSPDKPLSCGAKVWVETLAEVEIVS